jgi:hypothetical protein
MLDVLQAAGGVVAVITLLLYLVELRELRRQVAEGRAQAEEDRRLSRAQFDEMQAQSRGQHAFALVNYLEEPRHLHVRTIANSLASKSFASWTAEERDAADMVWRMWNVSCVFQSLQVLPDDFMAKFYGGTLVRHWHALKPYIEEMRAEFGQHRGAAWESAVHRTEMEHPELIPGLAANP